MGYLYCDPLVLGESTSDSPIRNDDGRFVATPSKHNSIMDGTDIAMFAAAERDSFVATGFDSEDVRHTSPTS